jgi:hypothetical protein
MIYQYILWFGFRCYATFNNISVISWWSVLLGSNCIVNMVMYFYLTSNICGLYYNIALWSSLSSICRQHHYLVIKIHDHINNTIWWLTYIANQMQLQIWVLSVSTGLQISRFSPETIFFLLVCLDPDNIFRVTDQSINCHIDPSAMNYLLNTITDWISNCSDIYHFRAPVVISNFYRIVYICILYSCFAHLCCFLSFHLVLCIYEFWIANSISFYKLHNVT